MTKRMVAFCGLVCTECPAYVATQRRDEQALEGIARKWRDEYHITGITVESIRCDGCLPLRGRKSGHCVECAIRLCALARGAVSCGRCVDYPCEKIEGFLRAAPEARSVLEEERSRPKARMGSDRE